MNDKKNKWLELKEEYHLSYGCIQSLTGIPKTTYQSWVYGQREPADYVYRLLQFYLQSVFRPVG